MLLLLLIHFFVSGTISELNWLKHSTYFSLSGVLLREDFMTSGVFVLSSFPDVATVGVVVVVDILWFLAVSLFQRQVLVIDKPRPASKV